MQAMIDLTDHFPMRFNVDRMRQELDDLENSPWVEHYDRKISNGWTTLLLSSRDGTMDRPDSMRPSWKSQFKRTSLLDHLPYFNEILDAFQCPTLRVRVSKLLPHSFSGSIATSPGKRPPSPTTRCDSIYRSQPMIKCGSTSLAMSST